MKKIKVLILTSWYSPSNPVAGSFVTEHVLAISSFCKPVIISHCRGKSFKKWIYEDEIEGIERWRVEPLIDIPNLHLIQLIGILKVVMINLKRKNFVPDVIHVHALGSSLEGFILSKLLKVPLIITEHWSGFKLKKLNFLQRITVRIVYNKADIILPVSKCLREAIKSYGVRNNFEVIPNPVDLQKFSFRKRGRKKRIKRILFVGGLVPVKGFDNLLYAIYKLSKRRKDFVLDVIGNGNREKYEELAKNYGCDSIIRFHGYLCKSKVSEFMGESDFLVLPSLCETFGCVLIEAMATGLPVVATNTGGIKEIVDEKKGLLVEPGNVEELIKAIDYMLDNYDKYSSEEIRKYVEERFSRERVGEMLFEIYKKLLSL